MLKHCFILLLITAVSCTSFNTYVKNLNSESASDRIESIYWLSQNAPGSTTQKLLVESLRNDKNEVVRSLAIRLIALQHHTDAIPVIAKSLQDSSALVRMEAAQSLGTLQAYSALPQLTAQLEKEQDILVRLKILKTINYLDATEAIPALVACLEDDESAVRFQALMLLEKFTQTQPGLDKESWQRWVRK